MFFEACLAAAVSLSDAKEVFAEQCPFLERVDCDPIDGEWVCANVMLGDAAPGIPRRAGTDTEAQIAPADGLVSGRCDAEANTLSGARRAYAARCADVRVDCDPLDVGYRCASYVMETAVRASGSQARTEPVQAIVTTDLTMGEEPSGISLSSTGIAYGGDLGEPNTGWADSYMDEQGRCWIRSTFDHGAGDLALEVASGRVMTVREARALLGPGPGQFADLAFNDVNCGHGPANDAGDEEVNQCPGLVTRGRTGCSLRGSSWKDRL